MSSLSPNTGLARLTLALLTAIVQIAGICERTAAQTSGVTVTQTCTPELLSQINDELLSARRDAENKSNLFDAVNSDYKKLVDRVRRLEDENQRLSADLQRPTPVTPAPVAPAPAPSPAVTAEVDGLLRQLAAVRDRMAP